MTDLMLTSYRNVNNVLESPVVIFRHVYKSFGKDGKYPVLNNFAMTVPKGTIYSLLGSSGCGKTTTLACIAGLQTIQSGEIRVLGWKPRSLHGSKVGYMPQDISLYKEFSIEETIFFFGIMCGMEHSKISRRLTFLLGLLHLPEQTRIIGTLSGGQQRRVSFSLAILHEPELLLLDEPTAGVDPLLRESIRMHLHSLVEANRVSVITTTHHMDEAKSSHIIGVIRSGKLIAEENPQILLQRYNTSSLETVMLNLCKHDTTVRHKAIQNFANEDYTAFTKSRAVVNSLRRLAAHTRKNWTRMMRNKILTVLTMCLPALIMALTCIAFRDEPKSLRLGVVNLETNMTNCFNHSTQNYNSEGCDLENLSCKFLQQLPPHIINLEAYNSVHEAVEGVRSADIWGFISIPENYSASYFERILSPMPDDEDSLAKSNINVRLDQTNKLIYGEIKKTLLDGFELYSKKLLSDCGYDERQGNFPLMYKQPILGHDGLAVLDFIAPGFALGWLLCFPSLSAAINLIGEKKLGTTERALVAGTRIWEIFLAFSITELPILLIQSVLVFLVFRFGFYLGHEGNPALMIGLLFIQGISGMSCGFLMAVVCNEEIEAALLGLAIFFPNTFISGSFWPREGMPLILQSVSTFLPFTLACEAMRSVMNRGWGLFHPNVWPGFLALTIYTCFYIVLAIIFQNSKHRK